MFAVSILFEAEQLHQKLTEGKIPFDEFQNSKSNQWESDLLVHLFNNTALTNYGDAGGLAGSSTAGSLYLSLHTGDPGETGDQTTSEATYTSYARVAVARSTAGWTVSGTAPTQVANAAAVNFPACTGGSNTVTYFGLGIASSSTGKLLYSGALTSSLAVSNGITPSFAIGALVITED